MPLASFSMSQTPKISDKSNRLFLVLLLVSVGFHTLLIHLIGSDVLKTESVSVTTSVINMLGVDMVSGSTGNANDAQSGNLPMPAGKTSPFEKSAPLQVNASNTPLAKQPSIDSSLTATPEEMPAAAPAPTEQATVVDSVHEESVEPVTASTLAVETKPIVESVTPESVTDSSSALTAQISKAENTLNQAASGSMSEIPALNESTAMQSTQSGRHGKAGNGKSRGGQGNFSKLSGAALSANAVAIAKTSATTMFSANRVGEGGIVKATQAACDYQCRQYVEDWRQKVERLGNVNYPSAAADANLEGKVLVRAVIGRQGEVKQVGIVRSSGHSVLDQAAIHIVKLGAPYPPLPSTLSEKYTALEIRRYWAFLPGSVFAGK